MLDPMTALGLASNIVQLVSFGGELISRGKELSKTGCTSEHAHVRTIAKDIGDLSAGLVDDATGQTQRDDSNDTHCVTCVLRKVTCDGEQPECRRCRRDGNKCEGYESRHRSDRVALGDLARDAIAIAKQLLLYLDDLRVQDGSRKRQIVLQTFKNVWRKDDVKKLQQRLDQLRQQMALRLTRMLRLAFNLTFPERTELTRDFSRSSSDISIAIQELSRSSKDVHQEMFIRLEALRSDVLAVMPKTQQRIAADDGSSSHPTGNDTKSEALNTALSHAADFPEDLDGYFQHMLDHIEGIYKPHSARILLGALYTTAPSLPLCAPAFLMAELCDPEYVLVQSPDQLGQYEELDVEQVRRYIGARCTDLLEIDQHGSEISFLHRTVKDFLSAKAVNLMLRREAGSDFDIFLSLSRVTLARHKTGLGALGESKSNWRVLMTEIFGYGRLVDQRSAYSYTALLDELDTMNNRLFHGRALHWTNYVDAAPQKHFESLLEYAEFYGLHDYAALKSQKRLGALHRDLPDEFMRWTTSSRNRPYEYSQQHGPREAGFVAEPKIDRKDSTETIIYAPLPG